MPKPSRPVSNPTYRVWSRVRVQLGGALFLAVLLPTASLIGFRPQVTDEGVIQPTVIGMSAAVIFSLYVLRNITLFPGIRTGYFIFPATLAGYAFTFSVLLFLRLDYSRMLLSSSFVICLSWLYLANFLANRGHSLKIGVVPCGEVSTLGEVGQVEWIWLSQPLLKMGTYDALVADFRADLPDEWEKFLADCALSGMPVFHVKQLRESLTGRVEIEHLSENSFGSLVPFMAYLRLRGLIDFVAALIVGVALLPLLLLVAALVRLDSPGPALYRQRRIGYQGRPFMVAKFRTMVHRREDEDERQGAMTQDNDERITRLGAFLRRSRIDELPQIINILRGEMSWIGPRPEAEVLSRWYEAELPFYRYRHIVPPGITGWAQVNQGHVADLKQVNYKLHFDFFYIKNFSPWLDALIIARTIQTVLTGFGSR